MTDYAPHPTAPPEPLEDMLTDLFGDADGPLPHRKGKRKSQTPHKRLVKAIVKALREAYPKCHLEVRNVALVKVGKRNNERTIRLGQPGEADIRFHLDGVAVALEAKAGRDTQRDSQERWQRRWEKSGGKYALCRSVDDAVTAVRDAIAEDRLMMAHTIMGAPKN